MNEQTQDTLRSQPPRTLTVARVQAHRAAQLLAQAAKENAAPLSDLAHANLGWDDENLSLTTRTLGGDAAVSLSLAPFELRLRVGNDKKALRLAQSSLGAAQTWLDEGLVEAKLKPTAGVSLPWELPENVAAVDAFVELEEFAVLNAWYQLASKTLEGFKASQSELRPGPSDVRCWPHHFDIATYVSLEDGDPEHAKGIGVGLSPGDESYNQPYIYVNPWPHLSRDNLPEAVTPGHWHTEGFVGLIATGAELLSASDIEAAARQFVGKAFDLGHSALTK